MAGIKIVLGSQSPRRKELVKQLGFPCEIRISEIVEIYPNDIDIYEVPEYLAIQKSKPLIDSITEDELLITADTIVIHQGKVMGKPKDKQEAIEMLSLLSGDKHEVITGVCLSNTKKTISFSSITTVYFGELIQEDIIKYIDEFKPYDKAGSYGIQDRLGYVGVRKIEGCYYNVMGLPVHDIYTKMMDEFS